MKKYLIAICLVFAGCANPGIVELSPDTYVLYRDDHGGIFGNSGRMRANVIREADMFAKSKGKVAIPISSTFTPMGEGPAQWASFEYQFRVVDKSDEEAVRTSLKARADIVVEKSVNITSTSKVEKEGEDIYSRLLKINDLKEKGIITEGEFQKMKSNILDKQ
jgi:hypothetical protein